VPVILFLSFAPGADSRLGTLFLKASGAAFKACFFTKAKYSGLTAKIAGNSLERQKTANFPRN